MATSKSEKAQSTVALRRNFSARVRDFKLKLKDFWVDNYDEIVSGVIVFLLVALAFGLGTFYGGKFYEDSKIEINCPPQFWEEGN